MGEEQKGRTKTMAIKRPALNLIAVWLAIITASLLMLLPLYAQNQAEKGEEALRNHNYVQALLYYQTALKYNPLSADIKAGAAKAFFVQGKILQDEIFIWAAKHYFEKAAYLEPLNLFRWRELGIYQARLGHLAEARAAYAQVLRLAPNVQVFKNEYDSLQKTIETINPK